MTNRLWTATLSSQSPRYAEWRSILDSDSVPLLSVAERRADFGEPIVDPNVSVYPLDVKSLSSEQRTRLVQHLARKFNAPLADVVHQLDTQGLAIRAEDVIVAYSTRGFM